MSTRKNHAHGINLAVAKELTSVRLGKGWTIEALAAEMPDTSLRSVNRYLSGESAIDIEDLERICDVLGVSMIVVLDAAKRRAAHESTLDRADIAEVDAAVAAVERATTKKSPPKGHQGRMRA